MTLKVKALKEIRHRANLPLQILLYLNVYLASLWITIYGLHVLYNISSLQDFHGFFVIVGFVITMCTELGRLYLGYSGNLKSKTNDLCSFILLTLFIQTPIQIFLFISVKSMVLLTIILMSSQFLFMLLECIIGIYVWHKLSAYNAEIYRLKREVKLADQIQSHIEN